MNEPVCVQIRISLAAKRIVSESFASECVREFFNDVAFRNEVEDLKYKPVGRFFHFREGVAKKAIGVVATAFGGILYVFVMTKKEAKASVREWNDKLL